MKIMNSRETLRGWARWWFGGGSGAVRARFGQGGGSGTMVRGRFGGGSGVVRASVLLSFAPFCINMLRLLKKTNSCIKKTCFNKIC